MSARAVRVDGRRAPVLCVGGSPAEAPARLCEVAHRTPYRLEALASAVG